MVGEVTEEPQAELLVVEDDGMHRLVFGAYLRGMGLGVVFAVHGEEALSRLGERSFALVLMDVDLPDMDGLQVTRRLRALELANPGRERTPVVALTAYGGANDVRRALTAGCDGYLVKPVTRELLRESVSRFASPRGLAPLRPSTIPDPTPELRAEFVESAEQMIAQLRSALERGRRDEIRRLAHKLRGSAGTFGLVEAGAIAADIESIALGAEMAILATAIDRLAIELSVGAPSSMPPDSPAP